ncbi:nitroreductase/quinone reductase family protein [Dactylosporangium sp. NPDC000555]|uniref:nitroreductase/quinone reductase family protein n=1 Tax=Dactylosporangium sp. NPDC000555 TaxID=3154260 RepID=UPI003322BEF9
MADFDQQVIDEFRASGGRVGGMFAGADLILLTTTGARSKRRRTLPVGYARDGERILIFASNGGLPGHPAWYHNLLASPRVTVELGEDVFDADATPLEGAERDRLYAEQGRRVPAYAAYQEQTTRVIPVVALHRVGDRARAIGEELVRIHATLRRDLSAVRADPRVHCLAFCAALRTHHLNEDGAFPRIERQFPQAGPVLARLREEHAGIARRIAELGEEPDPALLDRLARELDEHFAYEERALVPLLNQLR